jgi:succinate dehydrogenase hydrophobic anchor subunit
MREGEISIWFFIGVSLLVNGILITGAGVYQMYNPPANPVVLFNLHASVWWGAVLLVLGLAACVHFRPGRTA